MRIVGPHADQARIRQGMIPGRTGGLGLFARGEGGEVVLQLHRRALERGPDQLSRGDVADDRVPAVLRLPGDPAEIIDEPGQQTRVKPALLRRFGEGRLRLSVDALPVFTGRDEIPGRLAGEELRKEGDVGAVGRVGKPSLELRPPPLCRGVLRLDPGEFVGRQERNADQRGVAGHRARDQPGAEEDARQGVVVLGGDRVELVIVAAGAGDREAEEGPADDVDLVVDVVGDHLLLVHVAGHEVGDGQQAGGDEPVRVDPAGMRRRQQVAGDLVRGRTPCRAGRD